MNPEQAANTSPRLSLSRFIFVITAITLPLLALAAGACAVYGAVSLLPIIAGTYIVCLVAAVISFTPVVFLARWRVTGVMQGFLLGLLLRMSICIVGIFLLGYFMQQDLLRVCCWMAGWYLCLLGIEVVLICRLIASMDRADHTATEHQAAAGSETIT